MAEKKYRNTCVSNIVKQDSLREVQQWTLNELKKALLKSAGPYGSTT